ncbi:cytochrome P450 [Pseudooceanicola sp. CBS1P-1]|uniref:Cytochrome P450 n=1 Tax=Pseudooceanicola albus TaxID=2692189 RepID=A0A6L7G9D5_9RHOB|nr:MULTISPECIES: cytochrome P450 [Pseudooceanicola]MBT9382814.1 cytochrome P450 [Pseudooceanicola endophyticus]MXN20262.1 cytochrome P450 [Pseudooceanicola albus]
MPDDQSPPPALPVRVPLVTAPLGMLGSLRAARRNVLEILPELAVKQPIVSGRMGIRWHMLMDPAAIRRVLLERVEDYPKSGVTKNLLRPVIGHSLFIAEGAHWRWQRRAVAPVFSHRHVTGLGPVMSAAADHACARVAAAGPGAVDMADEMVRATFEVISEITFSGGKSFDRDAVHRAIDGYIAAAARVSILDMLGAPDWIPRPARALSGPVVKRMKAVADDAIASRRASGQRGPAPDLLDLLLAAEDPEEHRRMSDAELADNLLTFIVAGHETTALTLGWALYLCAFDPAVQDRARAEARAALGERTATAADLPQLPYLRAIIDEALRLYPPAAIISRTAQVPDRLCGREVRAGDTVMLPIYALHRNRLLWDRPDAFDPDRFTDRKAVPRYAYLPFGDGPRVCIGASFAVQEAVIILATLLARFRFTPIPGRNPRPVMILTLRPEGGIWLRAEALS